MKKKKGSIVRGLAAGMLVTTLGAGIAAPLMTIANHTVIAEEKGEPKWEYNNGRIYSDNLDAAVDYLNKNIEEIRVYTLGYAVLDTYYPGQYSADNPLIGKNGLINYDYKAASSQKKAQGDKLSLFKHLKDFETSDEKTNIRFIYLKFRSNSGNFCLIEYPNQLKFSKDEKDKIKDANVHEISGEGSNGYKIFLKVTMEDDGRTIRKVEDNHTTVNGPNANVWGLFVGGGGMDRYVGKTVDTIKKMQLVARNEKGQETAGVDAITSATSSSKDVHRIVSALLEKLSKEDSSVADKKDLLAKIKEAEETFEAINVGEYEASDAVNAFVKEFKKAKEVLKNKAADQDTVNKELEKLTRVFAAKMLVKPLNYKRYNEVITKANKVITDDFLDDSVKAFGSAMDEAIALYGRSMDHRNVRQKELYAAVDKLDKKMSELEEKPTDTVKRYKIKGSISLLGTKDAESMATDALSPDVDVKEKDGKVTYYLHFKPIYLDKIRAEVLDIKHIENGQDMPSSERAGTGEYNKIFAITREKAGEKEIVLKFGARMGGPDITYKKATLHLEREEESKPKEDSGVDKSDLKKVLAEAAEVEKAIANGEYADSSDFNKFKERYENAKKIMNKANATEDEVYDAKAKLSSVMYIDLILKPVDLTNIKETIKKAESIKEADYTKESYASLKKALDDAKSKVTRSESYRDVRQGILNASEADLAEALKMLKKPGEDKKPENKKPEENKPENKRPEDKKDPSTPDKKESDKKTEKRYTVSGTLYQYGSETFKEEDKSMMNQAIDPLITVTEKDGKATYEVRFRSLKYDQLVGSVLRLWHLQNGKFEEASLKMLKGEEYDRVYTFTRDKTQEEEITLQGFIDVMEKIKAGMGTKKALLKLDWSTKKEIKEGEAARPETPKKDNKKDMPKADNKPSDIKKLDVNPGVGNMDIRSVKKAPVSKSEMPNALNNKLNAPRTGDSRNIFVYLASAAVSAAALAGVVIKRRRNCKDK